MRHSVLSDFMNTGGESLESIVVRAPVMVPHMKVKAKPDFGQVTEPNETVFMRKLHSLEE